MSIAVSNAEYRRCKCGKRFKPITSRQKHCLPCIMAEKPKRPKFVDYSLGTTEHDEWMIYKWRTIRIAAAKCRASRRSSTTVSSKWRSLPNDNTPV